MLSYKVEAISGKVPNAILITKNTHREEIKIQITSFDNTSHENLSNSKHWLDLTLELRELVLSLF